MNALLEQLREHWLAQNIEISGGASEEEVAAFERKHGVALPPLFREYVRELNGMAGSASDDHFIAFWPLARIQNVAQHNYREYQGDDAQQYFIFADYSIESHHYAIRLSPDAAALAPTAFIYHKAELEVASFEEFLVRCLEGDEELLYLKDAAST